MDFLEIDGSQGEGGGQIIRSVMSLATIFGRPVRITKIRSGRERPGLKPQHLQSVFSAARLCDGVLKGASVGSTEIEYSPGKPVESFSGVIDTGTAGSISLIAQTIVPISLFCGTKLELEIKGGTEVSNSPTIDYLAKVVLPIYRLLGADISLEVIRRGYYPRGGGIAKLECSRTRQSNALEFVASSTVERVSILSVSRGLPSHVAERQLESTKKLLAEQGIVQVRNEVDSEGPSLSPGSSLLVCSNSGHSAIGASSLGERGKRAEAVGEDAARIFLLERRYSPSTDSHLADMLLTLLSCVKGVSRFTTSAITEHFKTNAAIAKSFSNCEIDYHEENNRWQVRVAGSSEKAN